MPGRIKMCMCLRKSGEQPEEDHGAVSKLVTHDQRDPSAHDGLAREQEDSYHQASVEPAPGAQAMTRYEEPGPVVSLVAHPLGSSPNQANAH